MKNKVYLVTYKVWDNPKSSLLDKIIATLTLSNYSHSEIYYRGKLYGISPRENKVRIKKLKHPNRWDFIELDLEISSIIKNALKYKGYSYSYIGAILSGIPFYKDCHPKNDKVFCSYLVTKVLEDCNYHINNGCSYNPKELRDLVYKRNQEKLIKNLYV